MISICLPVYNGAKYLAQCLDSILAQDFTDFEVVCVLDPSSDDSLDILQSYQLKDPRIKIILHSDSPGLVNNWNRCVIAASRPWIKFVFQDDFLQVNCLSEMMKATQHASFVVNQRDFQFEGNVDPDLVDFYSRRLKTFDTLKPGVSQFSASDIIQLSMQHFRSNFIGEPTSTMFHKSLVEKVGLFNSHLVQICDLEFWLRLAVQGGIAYVPEKLSTFRVHGDSASSANHDQQQFRLLQLDPLIMALEVAFHPIYQAYRDELQNQGHTHDALLIQQVQIAQNIFAQSSNQAVLKNQILEIQELYPILKTYWSL